MTSINIAMQGHHKAFIYLIDNIKASDLQEFYHGSLQQYSLSINSQIQKGKYVNLIKMKLLLLPCQSRNLMLIYYFANYPVFHFWFVLIVFGLIPGLGILVVAADCKCSLCLKFQYLIS